MEILELNEVIYLASQLPTTAQQAPRIRKELQNKAGCNSQLHQKASLSFSNLYRTDNKSAKQA